MILFEPSLRWIAQQQEAMCQSLREWCNINSGSENVEGLERMVAAVMPALDKLGGAVATIPLPPRTIINSNGEAETSPLGKAIIVRKRGDAPLRVLLGIHIDTVYGRTWPFQSVTPIDSGRWRGPGVADAKGGLIVMLTALQALERSGGAEKVGWEILINPDEEIGSVGSGPLFTAAAKRNHLGLIFEPALPDGNLVSSRKGSWNYVIVLRGRSAHVGRDIAAGRNAIHALAGFISGVAAMQNPDRGITVNVGKIEGGGPVNVVPDLAIARFNVRAANSDDHAAVESKIRESIAALNDNGISAVLHLVSSAPPKPIDDATQKLFDSIADCGRELGLILSSRPSGGVCDGNRLAAAGLPTVDTLGVRGGDLHSPSEFIEIDSLVERASLTAMLLLKLAAGQSAPPKGNGR